MVGDGVNDAPVLAAADVSMTVKGGAELANSTADLILIGESLGLVATARAIARRARQLIRQNLAWAVGYNLVALPAAAIGLIAPWMAAIGMSATLEPFEFYRDLVIAGGDLIYDGFEVAAASCEPEWDAYMAMHREIRAPVEAVLGNHDLHLIARARGLAARRRKDTLDAILAAPDAERLVDWLRRRPLVHRERGFLLVHAGLLAAWGPDAAAARARHAEERLLRDDTLLERLVLPPGVQHLTREAAPTGAAA